MAALPDAWARMAAARVARLATVGRDETPHLVPCCFVVDGLEAYSAVDDKPKTTCRLRRLTDLATHPVATLLVDHYDDDDWGRLWWVRAGGHSRELGGGAEHDRAVRLLLGKYAQYRDHRLDGPILALHLSRWRSWAAWST